VRPARIGADLRVVVRSYTRNPVALFFSLIFPIILIGLFGLIFSSIGSTSATLVVLNEDHNSPYSQEFLSALNNTTLVSVQLVNVSPSDFGTWLGQNGDSAGMIIPAGFQANATNNTTTNLTLFVNPDDATTEGEVVAAIQGVAAAFNLEAKCGHAPSCTPVIGLAPLHNVGRQIYTYIDYLIPGLIGFSILTSPMFSLVDVSSSYRKQGIFRQLSLTPLTRGEWLTARIVWYTLLTLIAACIVIGTGVYAFGAHVTLTLGVLPFLIVGPFFFVSLGMLCGTVSKTPEAAALIGNIVTFPMMFLSGTFFQVSSFPPDLAAVAHVLPLYYIIDGMNQVMLFQNSGRALTDFVIVLVASIVVFLLAVRLFQWRDER
jgi:ABC-2 type transport system permease protein